MVVIVPKLLYLGKFSFVRVNVVVLPGKGVCIRVKDVVFWQNCCISRKIVVFGGKSGYSLAKWLYSGKGGCIRAKSGCIREKLLYSGQNCCIRAKRVIFGQSGLDCPNTTSLPECNHFFPIKQLFHEYNDFYPE